jgi:type I restriction enzyme, S subunit
MTTHLPKVAGASRLSSPQDQKQDASATLSSAPKGRNISAQGNALGNRPPKNLSPEGAAPMVDACETGDQLLRCLLKLREQAHHGPGKYHPPVEPDITDLPELPAHWTWASPSQLSSAARNALAIGPFGSNLKVSDYQDEGVPLVFVRNIRSEVYADGTKFVSESKAKELASHTVDPGDLLVTKMGEPPGDSSIYPIGAPKAVITADCIKWRVAPDLNPKFFMYALRSETTKRQIAARTRGVAQKKVSLERFRDLALPLPSFPEQRRIVARIEELFSRLDAGVAALRHAKAQRYRQSVLAAAVTGQLTQAWREQHPDTEPAAKLLESILSERRQNWRGRGKYEVPAKPEGAFDELPASGEPITFGHICQVQGGFAFKSKDFVSEGINLVKIASLRAGKVDLDHNPTYLPIRYLAEYSRFALRKGDTLIAMSGATTGKMGVYESEDPSLLNQRVGRFLPYTETHVTAGFLSLLVEQIGDRVLKEAYGAAQPNISPTEIEEMPFPLPPLAEQHQIVAELDHQITRSNRLRQSTLQAAFDGQLLY